MKRIALFLLGLGLLWAQGAWAATAETGGWKLSCQGNQTTKSMTAGSMVCYTPASGAALDSASPFLAVTACENFDAFLHDDFDGDGTACTVTWQLQMCPPPVNLTTDALKNAACNTLPGVGAMTGDDAKSNLAGEYIRVVGGGAGANINSCQVVIKCAEPSEK
jgi:hypothetical protein